MKEYKKTFLRALCPDDIKVLYSWFNDIEIAKFNGIPFRFHTKEDLKRKFFAHENQLLNYSLMICNNKKKPLGVIRYRKNRPYNTGVEVYIFWGDKKNIFLYWLESLYLLSKYIFDELGYLRLTISLSGQLIKLGDELDKIGFVKEAVKKEERYFNGIYNDSIIYGLLKDEFIR